MAFYWVCVLFSGIFSDLSRVPIFCHFLRAKVKYGQEVGLDVGWRFIRALNPKLHPKGPSTQIVDKLAPKYPNRHCFKAKVYTIWVHGLLGNPKP